jgi:Dolichyl-phosphate-mannose-protein mannosyltransferase
MHNYLGGLSQKPVFLFVTLCLIFGSALGIRLHHLEKSHIIAERQFRSALIARAYYFDATGALPEWRRHLATTSKERGGLLEPPIMELLVSALYFTVGGESLKIASLLSSAFWLIGGTFLFRIARTVFSTDAAVFATLYYLFVPLGVIVSVSFLPEPFMMLMLLASVLTLLRYHAQPSMFRLIIGSLVSGLAILVKPFCVFTVFSVYLALAIHEKYSQNRINNSKHLIFFGLSFLIGVSYYLYAIFGAGFLGSHFQASFLPYLYFTEKYWRGWIFTAADAVGYGFLIIGVGAIGIISKGMARSLLVGLWIGYIIFGLVYAYPMPISGHYHLQLLIIAALAFGVTISVLVDCMRKLSNRWIWWAPFIAAVVLGLVLSIQATRVRFAMGKQVESRAIAQEIGNIVQHSDKVAYLATYYGMPLEYYGELSGTYWPRRLVNWDWVKDRQQGIIEQSKQDWSRRITNWIFRRLEQRELSIQERFEGLNIVPEYFVITDFDEFNRHHGDLKVFLEHNCSLIAKRDKYLIYRDCASQSRQHKYVAKL